MKNDTEEKSKLYKYENNNSALLKSLGMYLPYKAQAYFKK